jgi:phosphoglycerol transferase MdoB-like AlkP superfamily enzyme
MRVRTHYLLRIALFWLVFFALFRILFIAFHNDRLPDGYLFNTFLGLFAGIRLDISTISYILLFPFLLWTIQQFYRHRSIQWIAHAYNVILIFALSLVCIGNIRLFTEWGTLLNARALRYLAYPQEMMHFATPASILMAVFAWLIISVGLTILYRSLGIHFSYPVEKRWMKAGQLILFPVLLLVGVRGGVQLTPVNESAAYYSQFPINNKIATNPVWYLVHSVIESQAEKNPYVTLDPAAAQQRAGYLLARSGKPSQQILSTQRPNVVLIILESWTYDIVTEKNVSPNFQALSKEGLLFTNAYSSGFRTDQGLCTILSGFPSQPNNSIITTPDKAEGLASIVQELAKDGYSTSFYYGGEVEFANMKSYLLNCGFSNITDKNSFRADQYNSKWGVHDGPVFDRQLSGLRKEKHPFFSTLLTLSTHEPFEVPGPTPFTGEDLPSKFRKSAWYTDKCLGEYFAKAKLEPWYKNTVFVLVADHGHHLPNNRNLAFPDSRRISFMIMGGALSEEYRGKTIDKVVEQTCIPSTLLAQLGKDTKLFPWSRDVFDPGYKEFAYYSLENVLGWITPQQRIVYTYVPPRVDKLEAVTDSTLNDSLLTDAKAYLQALYDQYLLY